MCLIHAVTIHRSVCSYRRSLIQPTIVTGYSGVDQATHEAQNLPPILKSIGAQWAIPLQPNPYAIKVRPADDFPPMQLWAPPGEEEEQFTGISAKNAGECRWSHIIVAEYLRQNKIW